MHPLKLPAALLAVLGMATASPAAEHPVPTAAETEALRLAIEDLASTFPDRYRRADEFLGRLKGITDEPGFHALQREALLANPLLAFDKLLVIRRAERQLGLPWNWEGNSSLPQTGYVNEIATLSLAGELRTLVRPEGGRFAGDVDLDFDAGHILFSMPGEGGRWQVFEAATDGTGLQQLPLIKEPDVDNYDACYLPDGDIIFSSTAPFTGVPCVTGSSHVSNLYRLDRRTGRTRRLTFDQEHDWCPTVLDDGRVLYLRWEYSDIPHFVSRILFTMNPDGTNQREFYGSNSYWPNSTFYARPIPGSSTKFVGIVSGHHDTQRMGELVLFDAARSRFEADGAIQRIPGRGKKVEAVIRDGLVGGSWPKFLHPWPLSDRYFLVSAKPTSTAKWGIYLADVFDNLVLLKEDAEGALLEPIPLRRRPHPPTIPSRVNPDSKDAVISISDVYAGPGLAGVPRGTVKALRLFTYHFAYHNMGGQVNRVGLDGPWDIKRIMGTVPVEADGSAHFRVPANTPISIQPLDADGQALQLMRSWMTAMPGEQLSCAGCHERQNSGPAVRRTIASSKPPADIRPWYGPTRGFSFRREVQPVLDRHCARCHAEYRDGPDVRPQAGDSGYNNGTAFPPSYIALKSFVRNATIESDMHLLDPGEFASDTTFLIQLLRCGHKDVKLDPESWDRLITWIDLNTPAHGTWHEIVGEKLVNHQRDRRREMLMRYAGIDEDPESMVDRGTGIQPVSDTGKMPVPQPDQRPSTSAATIAPIASEGGALQHRVLDLGAGITLDVIRVPASRPYWLGRCEVSNRQFAQYDPAHDSRIEVGDFLQFSERERGYPMNQPDQPVLRISWEEAMSFCRWLSAKSGMKVSVPSGEQWELACRAGGATPMGYGAVESDFSKFANLADASFRFVDTLGWGLPSGAVPPWRPGITNVNDRFRVTAPIGSFAPNAWGVCDMHGNVSEWTLEEGVDGRRIVRGGSFADRPARATVESRLAYPSWRRVYNVGFRIACELEGK
jgi:hypothetical protein